jgi:hypothetical protein
MTIRYEDVQSPDMNVTVGGAPSGFRRAMRRLRGKASVTP